MVLHAPAEEARARGEDEVAGHPFPHEMKIVARVPHVLPRAGDLIGLLLGIVRRGAARSADVRLGGEDTDGGLSGEAMPEAGETDGDAQCHGPNPYMDRTRPRPPSPPSTDA